MKDGVFIFGLGRINIYTCLWVEGFVVVVRLDDGDPHYLPTCHTIAEDRTMSAVQFDQLYEVTTGLLC